MTGTRPDRNAGIATRVASGLAIAVGVTQVLHPPDTDPAIEPRTAAVLVGSSAMLWALVVLYHRLAATLGSLLSARVASTGTVLLSVGMLSSAVNGEDLSVFPAIAMVANRCGARARSVRPPRCGAAGRCPDRWWRCSRSSRRSLFLSQMGGGVPVGAYLAVLGWLLLRAQLDRHV